MFELLFMLTLFMLVLTQFLPEESCAREGLNKKKPAPRPHTVRTKKAKASTTTAKQRRCHPMYL